MMRFVDMLYSLPFMFFVILLVAYFGRHLILLFLALGAVQWLTMSRIVRGQMISLRGQEFVQAVVALGASHRAHRLSPPHPQPARARSSSTPPSPCPR